MSRPAKVLLTACALLAVAVLASGCGTQKVSVPKSQAALYEGATLFNQRCSGCHTLSYAATHGSAQNVRTAQFNNGPNFDIRCERPVARVLYAIQNGGFSGAIMPQNIVVGQQALDVAQFVATYAGHAAPFIAGTVRCRQQPIGSITEALATPVTSSTTSTTTTTTSTTHTSTTSTSTTSASTSAAGKSIFTSAGCAGCHTLAAAGATGTIGPNLDARLRTDCATAASKHIRGATLAECIHTAITDPYKYLPSGYAAGIMPSSFGKTLTPAELGELVSFLESAAK